MRPLSTYKAFIFDFDGVIVDSVHIKADAFAELFKEFGSDIQKQVVEHHLAHGGMTRAEKISHYYIEFVGKKLTEENLNNLCNEFSELVVEKVIVAPEILGAEKLIRTFCVEKKCFINSATPDDELNEIVKCRGIYDCFLEIFGSNRTKIENLEYIINKYNYSLGEHLFFGDAFSDYNASYECGVDFVGILFNDDSPLVKLANEITIFKNFNELLGSDRMV
jgi:phosphoglycolate phosphatase-like HAD superfamily hydrolase